MLKAFAVAIRWPECFGLFRQFGAFKSYFVGAFLIRSLSNLLKFVLAKMLLV